MMEPAHRKALVYKVSFIISLTCNSLPLIDELQEESNEGYFGIVDRRVIRYVPVGINRTFIFN